MTSLFDEPEADVEPASFFGDRIRGQLKQHPEIDQNLRGTLGGVVGDGFSPAEINILENRAIDAAGPLDALTLMGLQAGAPVTLNTKQWTTIPLGNGPIPRSSPVWRTGRSGSGEGSAMKAAVLISMVGIGLAGCNGPVVTASGGAAGAHSRYMGAGLYPAGRIWSQVQGAPGSQDPAAARLADDEQIIVVVDGQTGEVRQCGNVSGYCVGMNPWSKPAGSTPAALAKHADQLETEARAKLSAPPAAR